MGGRFSVHVHASYSKARGLGITEREALAVSHSFKTVYHYLFNSECTVYTDHKSLEYIFNSKKTGKTLEAVEALSRAPIALVLAVRFVVNDWLEAQRVDGL